MFVYLLKLISCNFLQREYILKSSVIKSILKTVLVNPENNNCSQSTTEYIAEVGGFQSFSLKDQHIKPKTVTRMIFGTSPTQEQDGIQGTRLTSTVPLAFRLRRLRKLQNSI